MHNNHSTPEPKHEISNQREDFADNPYVEMITKNINNIFIAIALLLLFCFAIYKMSSRNQAQAEADYLTAEKEWSVIIGGVDSSVQEPQREDAIKHLGAILADNPELESKYDAPLAQVLILEGQAGEARLLADQVFERTKDNGLTHFTDLGKISLLIAEQSYDEALKQSIILKDKAFLSKDRTDRDALIAYNLLQIAALQQQIGNTKEELDAWKEVSRYLQSSDGQEAAASPQTSAFIQQIFAEGSTTLKDYIDKRESILKQ